MKYIESIPIGKLLIDLCKKNPKSIRAILFLMGVCFLTAPADTRNEIISYVYGTQVEQSQSPAQKEWASKFIMTETSYLLQNGIYDEERVKTLLDFIDIHRNSFGEFQGSNYERAEQLLVIKYRRVLKEDISAESK